MRVSAVSLQARQRKKRKETRKPKARRLHPQASRSASPRRRWLLIIGLPLIVAGLVSYPFVWQEYRLQRAGQLLRQREVEAAQPWIEAALRQDPDRGAAHFLAARAARLEGRLAKVSDWLRKAWEAGYDRQRIEREEWLALAQSGQLDEAAPHRDEMLADPRGEAALICEAYVNGYLRAYRFQEALRLLDAWQADFPHDPQPHFCRALVWEHLTKRADAVEEYEAVLRIAPERTDARVRLADQLASLHRYEEAGEHYRLCLERNPDDLQARLGYASCLLEQGYVEEPENMFREVLRESPGDLRARIGLGSLALAAGKNEEAVEILQGVVDEKPTSLGARYKLASALQALGRGDEAQGHFEFVSKANKGLARVRALLEGLRDDPNQVAPRLEAARLLLQYGSPEDGVAWLQSILQLEPDHPEAHRELADYYEARNLPDLAARHRGMIPPDEGTDTP